MVVHELPRFVSGEAIASMQPPGEYLRFGDVWRFLKRNASIIALGAAAGLALGWVYIANTPPTYSAYARIVIDPEPARIVSQDPNVGTIIVEAAEVASKVEIVKSEAIALAVIRQLDLTKDAELVEARSWRGRIRNAFRTLMGDGPSNPQVSPAEDLMRRAMAGFLSRVEVRRVGQSYVLEIGYSSADPEKAAVTANAIAMAYIRTGIDAKAQAARSGAAWLEGRLIDVGKRAKEATLAVQEFRARNAMPELGSEISLDERQIADSNTQLLAARAQTSQESAKLETLDAILNGGAIDGYVDEALRSSQIQRLRDAILATTVKLSEMESRFGATSDSVRTLKAELASLNASIRDELLRIRAVYSSNLATAKSREALLEADFQHRLGAASGRNDARAELAELESRANTYRRMYESVLQQLMSTLQRESFPVGDARVVTPAAKPFVHSWPKSSVVSVFSLVCGLLLGVGAAAGRTMLDRRIVGKPGRLKELGLADLGTLPRIDIGDAAREQSLVAARRSRSPFSRALLTVKSAIETHLPLKAKRVIGVMPVKTGDGATTVAVNLAHLYASEGYRPALVDADLFGYGLTAAVRVHGDEVGLHAGADDKASPETISIVPLPVAGSSKTAATSPIVALKTRLAAAIHAHPVTIVDLPSLDDVIELQGIAGMVDAIVLVADAASSARADDVDRRLAAMGNNRSRVIGVAFNKDEVKSPLARPVKTARRGLGKMIRSVAPFGQAASSAPQMLQRLKSWVRS